MRLAQFPSLQCEPGGVYWCGTLELRLERSRLALSPGRAPGPGVSMLAVHSLRTPIGKGPTPSKIGEPSISCATAKFHRACVVSNS